MGSNDTPKNQKGSGISMEERLIVIFCEIDDFCNEYEEYCRHNSLPETTGPKKRSRLALSEIMTIIVYFHLSQYRTFKWYYKNHVSEYLREYFPNLVSYTRFVELMQQSSVPLLLYLMTHRLGKCSGISFIDSTPLKVCDPHRIHSHKVFKGIARRGKSSTGWFFGFKLHLVVSDTGELLGFRLTPGNVSDADVDVVDKITKNQFGRLFGDKGYISKKLFTRLWEKNIQLITKVKANMKNKFMRLEDKLLLRKRALIESVNDFLKNICQVEHSRHRSVSNFLVNVFSALIAYSFIPSKPSLNLRDNLFLPC